jgi:hypothetical protein
VATATAVSKALSSSRLVLSRVFRGKFVDGLKRAFRQDKLVFFGRSLRLTQEKALSAFLRARFREDWVVYAKRPFGGPEHEPHYVPRYTHRIQPSTGSDDRRSSVVSMEGLCASQQAPRDDSQS